MSPDVLARKLAKLRLFLSDLRPYEGASLSEFLKLFQERLDQMEKG